MENTTPLRSVIDDVEECTEKSKATVLDLFEAFGHRSFGPILILLGLLAMSPVGAIPGIPVALAILTIIISLQIVFGRDSLWLPEVFNKIKIEHDSIEKMDSKLGKLPDKIDILLKKRLEWAAGKTANRIAATVCVILSITMIPLEIIPFGVALPAAGLVLFGLALVAKDGLFMIGGFIASLAVLGGALSLVF